MMNRTGAGLTAEPPGAGSGHSFQERAVGDAARSLPPRAFRSLDFANLEDEGIWTRSWVSIGFSDEILAPGDVLPFTVGRHGVHVERQAHGGLIGRFNKAQHGGCRAVPLQCQTGAKTKCSFTACGYSRDRRPITRSAADAELALDQYLGLRPERLLPVAVRMFGGLICVNVDPLGAGAPSWRDATIAVEDVAAAEKRGAEATHWLEFDADWKLLAHHLAAGAEESSGPDFIRTLIRLDSGALAAATILFPNAIVIRAHGQTCTVILQPTALGRTLCRIRLGGEFPTDDAYSAALRLWLGEIAPRLSAAEAAQLAARFDPTDRESEEAERAPLRNAAAPAAWLQSVVNEAIRSTPPIAGEAFYATSQTGRRA
ncbi:hypothetical protein [Methylocella tundrae]|uniref:hypothetical protein n=1 Tax=Methylocella tundrae TaxID=227605 RepID=UPI0030FE7B0F|nr:hypothetical protein SIN04_10145 [Methylocella tundrae]